jgi:SAM-dependent methyltransferase
MLGVTARKERLGSAIDTYGEEPIVVKYGNRLELARGYFERIALMGGGLLVQGWMLLPDKEFGSFHLYLDGTFGGSADVTPRDDVATAFRQFDHAKQSGFHFHVFRLGDETTRAGQIEVIGCNRDGHPIARMSSLFRADLNIGVPTPPAELMRRVAHTEDPLFFKIGGLKTFGEFVDVLSRHRELRSVRRLLDWGCGCGRVIVHFLSEPNISEVFGCDIDPDAIEWCRDHLQAGHFARIEPWPPTLYEDNMFDLVVAHSVFTHLHRDDQKVWLSEMRRIIAPGGLFLASTHGRFAALFAFPDVLHRDRSPRGLVRTLKDMVAGRHRSDEVFQDGIRDEMTDSTLTGVAPEGYYRSVFQTPEYTLREWSKYFEIVEYVERGMGNFQDLVVMKRPV